MAKQGGMGGMDIRTLRLLRTVVVLGFVLGFLIPLKVVMWG